MSLAALSALMRNTKLLTVVVAVLLAGCVGPLQTGVNDGGDGSTISVSAPGSATADPDRAVVRLGVEATADSADDARSQVAGGVESVRTALADAGVPEVNVTTAAFGIAPVYDRTETGRERTGYRAVHALTVETTPARAGELVDVAVEAGATNVDGVQFTLSDDRLAELRATALDRALRASRTDADGIAAATDLSVTGVRHVSTGTSFDPYAGTRFEADAGGGGIVIDPAPVTVTVSVGVTYSAR
ncbi:MAG: SIMPL domain-containing protein [Haloplanus sp.]